MKRNETIFGFLLFVFVAAAFYGSPVHYLSDSRYSLLMDQAILDYRTPNMIEYQVPRNGPLDINHGYLWTIDLIKGRLLYKPPWGAALLSLPEVAVFNAAGIRIAPNKVYDENNELRVQVILATLLCALTVVVFYETALLLLPVGWALLISLVAAFGTQIWSSASRSLWAQTWYVLLIAIAIWLLLDSRPRPLLLGTVLAWACLARPGAPPIVGLISVYLLLESRLILFLRYALAGALWTLLFAGTTMYFEGAPLAAAYQLRSLSLRRGFIEALEGVLFSPSRGLVVYVPIVVVPLYLLLRYWRTLPQRRLAILGLLAISVHIVILASWRLWWGGGSYGPRDLLEAVPWVVLLSLLGVRALLSDPTFTWQRRRLFCAVSLALLIVSVAMNAVGAVSTSTLEWNDHPQVNDHPERLWDWHHPQFLAWLNR